MRAAILAVGSELLGPYRAETNSLTLARILRRFGVELARKTVVGDSLPSIAGEVESCLAAGELVLVSGGLGPTSDDLTREAVAEALGLELERNGEVVADIQAKFDRFGHPMADVNRRQADILDGAEILWNARGTAPGQRITVDRGTLFLLPGVPHELAAMAEKYLAPWLAARRGAEQVETACLKVACMAESAVEERLAPYYEAFGADGLSVLPAPGDITLEVTRRGDVAGRRRELEERLERLAGLLGDAVYGRRRDDTLEAVTGALLAGRGETVATAESCTGGLLGERLTRVPGSSAYYLGGVVAYSNELKRRFLGIGDEVLERHGAVSEPVARAMAVAVRERTGSDWGLSITGVAGPGGGSEEKPVGTVHLAVAGPGEAAAEAVHRRLQLPFDRRRVRRLASQWTLDQLRRRLAETGTDAG